MATDGNKEYRDSTHVPADNPLNRAIKAGTQSDEARYAAKSTREKKWGVDVREIIAEAILWIDTKFNALKNAFLKLVGRQEQVEHRQTDLENQFKDVIANATKDSEVINARDSSRYGKFAVLRDRLEHTEELISQYIPVGFDVIIQHNLGRNPKVNVFSYDYGLGLVPLGTEPKGLWGGIALVSVPCKLSYPDANTVKVTMPEANKLNGVPHLDLDDNFRLSDGIHTLKFDFGGAVPIHENLIKDSSSEVRAVTIKAGEWYTKFHHISVSPNTTYTYAFEVTQTDGDTSAVVDMFNKDGQWITAKRDNVLHAGQTGRLVNTFKTTDKTTLINVFVGNPKPAGKTVTTHYRCEKLELGDHATPWVP